MKVVCLCGSTRFKQEFEAATFQEAVNGNIVLSVACFTHSDNLDITMEHIYKFRALHVAKIMMADEILVVNPGNYIGNSTRQEITLTELLGKPVRYMYGVDK